MKEPVEYAVKIVLDNGRELFATKNTIANYFRSLQSNTQRHFIEASNERFTSEPTHHIVDGDRIVEFYLTLEELMELCPEAFD